VCIASLTADGAPVSAPDLQLALQAARSAPDSHSI
jgi:nitroreductase